VTTSGKKRRKPKARTTTTAGHDAAKMLADMARIDDDMTIYLIGMLIERVAELAAARRNGEPDPPGARMQ
jgi:hypothetical protein